MLLSRWTPLRPCGVALSRPCLAPSRPCVAPSRPLRQVSSRAGDQPRRPTPTPKRRADLDTVDTMVRALAETTINPLHEKVSTLTATVAVLERDVISLSVRLAKAQGTLDSRSALEIVVKATVPQVVPPQGATPVRGVRPGVQTTLNALIRSRELRRYVADACARHNTRVHLPDILAACGTLYNALSSSLHGSTSNSIRITEGSGGMNGNHCAALAMIFDFYGVEYEYFTSADKATPKPYA